MIKISVFNQFNKELKCLWLDLQERSEIYMFQTYNWLAHWQKTIGVANQNEPCIVVVEVFGRIEIIIPFCIEKKYGIKFLTFLGGEYTDYHMPICSSKGEHLLLDNKIWQKILKVVPNYDVLNIKKIPENVILSGIIAISGIKFNVISHSYSINLPSDWLEYKEKYLPRKTDGRRKRKQLSALGTLRFDVIEKNSPEYLSVFQALVKEKQKRYISTGLKDMFSDESAFNFYFSMPVNVGNNAVTNLSVLRLDNHILAAHWGVVDKDRLYWLVPAFSSAWSKYSPGRLLLEHLIEWSYSKGIKVFDFTIGEEDYKKEWCNDEMPLYDAISVDSLRGYVYSILLLVKEKLKNKEKIYKTVSKIKAFIKTIKK